jgi:hypothetical protein
VVAARHPRPGLTTSWPAFFFFFFSFVFKKISLYIYFLINLYFFY